MTGFRVLFSMSASIMPPNSKQVFQPEPDLYTNIENPADGCFPPGKPPAVKSPPTSPLPGKFLLTKRIKRPTSKTQPCKHPSKLRRRPFQQKACQNSPRAAPSIISRIVRRTSKASAFRSGGNSLAPWIRKSMLRLYIQSLPSLLSTKLMVHGMKAV